MIFSRKAVGIEICQDEARFALIGGKRHAPRLDASSVVSFPPETMSLSLREENVKNSEAFIAKLRDGHLQLLSGISRVSVSLPDSIGRVVMLDLETRFKTRDEGADIIRWKLKKSFPFDVNELHLDYQVIQERESGEVSTLVTLIGRRVVKQYEDLLLEAGLQANRIDFTTFNISRLFSSRLEIVENAAMVIWHQGMISIMIFSNGLLEFFRAKDLSGAGSGSNRIFREISSSLQVYKDKHAGYTMNEVFCVAPQGEAGAFRGVVAEATGLQPIVLDVGRIMSSGSGLNADGNRLHAAAAAIGAAVRNL